MVNWMGRDKTCRACGSALSSQDVRCPVCGRKVSDSPVIDVAKLRKKAESIERQQVEKPSVQESGTGQNDGAVRRTDGTNCESAGQDGGETNGHSEKKSGWLKIGGGIVLVAAVIALLFGIFGTSHEEKEYQAAVRAIATEVTEYHADLKKQVKSLDAYNRKRIVANLSDNKAIGDLYQKYNAINVPKNMEEEYVRLGELLKEEEKLRVLVRGIYDNPSAKNIDGEIKRIREMTETIEKRSSAIKGFEQVEPLIGLDKLVAQAVNDAQKMRKQGNRQQFVNKVNFILEQYTQLCRADDAIHKLLEKSRIDSVKKGKYRENIQAEREALQSARGILNNLEVPSDAKDLVNRLDIILRVRMDCCERMLKVPSVRSSEEQGRMLSSVLGDCIAAEEARDEFMREYEKYLAQSGNNL